LTVVEGWVRVGKEPGKRQKDKEKRAMTSKTFHFDMRHAANKTSSMDRESYYLRVRGRVIQLKVHDEESRSNVYYHNRNIALLAQQEPDAVTHYAEIPMEFLPDNQLSRIEVIGPNKNNPRVDLPDLYSFSYYIPEIHRRRHLKRKMEKYGLVTHPKMQSYGVLQAALTSLEEALNAYIEADYFQTPLDIAVGLLFQHPELATNKPEIATIAIHDHINPPQAIDPDQYNRVQELAIRISSQGPATERGGWATIQQSQTDDGQLMYAEFDWTDSNGEEIYKTGDPIMIYVMSVETESMVGAPVSHALRSSRNDPSLKNNLWSVNQGTSVVQKEVSELQPDARTMLDASAENTIWTATNKTPHHGLNVYPDTIKYDTNNARFSMDVKNTYLRALGTFVEFFSDTEMTQPISNPEVSGGWPFYFPEELAKVFETDTKKGLGTVPNVNTIMGIPMPTDPTNVSVPWPKEAQAAKLLFGCAGTSRWDNRIVWPGFILTGVFQYGVPLFFLAAGAAVTNTQWYKEFIEDTEKIMIVLGVSFGPVSGGVAVGAALGNTKKVLSTFAGIVTGLLVTKGMEKFAAYITAKLVAAEVKSAIPIVGMAFRVASIALDVANMAVTTGELLSSPAVLEVDIKRQMTLNFTLHPDPKHGEPGRPETAIWPAVANNCQVILEYKNGTNYTLAQKLPATSSNKPLDFSFKGIGWGGSFTITASVFSESGWLCGKYRSDEIPAIPDDVNTGIKKVEGSITELLVPLTQDSQYEYKQKLGYDAEQKQHKWIVGSVPIATESDLSCSNVGQNLCKLVNITINQKAYQVGYTYQASAQNIPLEDPASPPNSGQMYVFQNISVLSDETINERLKFPKIGFKVQPDIAYDTYGEGPSEDEISPNNFILDSRNGEYYLRQVDLMNGKHDFGLTEGDLKAWGKFHIPHLDAMVVHPSGYVIAVSWEYSKIQILQLPSEPVRDKLAPEAQILSGQGILQGLTYGPIAVTVTPDGRILLLETINQRIQAFDTKGNPVPSFPGATLFSLPTVEYQSDLDRQVFSNDLQEQFKKQGLTYLFDLTDSSLIQELDSQILTENLIAAFAANGVFLTYNLDEEGKISPEGSTYITVQTKRSLWTVTDPNKNYVYSVKNDSRTLKVFDFLQNVEVSVIAQGSKWVVADLTGAKSYLLQVRVSDASQIDVADYLSYMPLHEPDNITYLDLAVESKGYIYVLSRVKKTTTAERNTDYILDIYNPDGTFLVRSPDPRLHSDPSKMQYVSAARLTLDIWRSVFTLNYESFPGPQGRTEPSISQWIPTTPLFELPGDADTLKIFQDGDMNQIRALFADRGITLSGAGVKGLASWF